jgi:SulP family sulfate permease
MQTNENGRFTPLERLLSMLPIFIWLPKYERAWLRADLMAGLAVWAMTVPQALAYAGIAGVPPVYGLYTVPLAMLAYSIFGSSRTMCVGPESAIAIISAITVGALVSENSEEFLAVTGLLALLVGVLFLLFGLLRLGWVANFLSQPVLQGFTQGIALTVIVSQVPLLFGTREAASIIVKELRNLPQMFGFELEHIGFILQTWGVMNTLGEANMATVAVGFLSLTLLFSFRYFRPQAPSALITVLLAVTAVFLLRLDEHGVSIIGEIQSGMVGLALPVLSVEKVLALIPGALAIVLLGYSVSLSVAKVGAQTTGEEIDPNQELIALGMGNLGASFSAGFVVCGSLSRGSVITRAGGQTQVVCLINAGLVLLTLAFALPLFFKLPQATLAAIVITAMSGLVSLGYFKKLWHIDRGEFAYALAGLLGVLLLGILHGVALGVALSLAVLIWRVSYPATAVLGRLKGTSNFRDLSVHPAAEPIPGLLIFRFDAPIIFANSSYLADQIRRRVAEAVVPVKEVLLPAHQINHLDATGADQLEKLQAELKGKGIRFSFAEVKHVLQDALRRTGLEEKVGAKQFYESIEEGVEAFLRQQQHVSSK